MQFSESFKQAISSLKSNKLRSILTMLGIIMGVFSVITIVAIGNAAQGYIDAQFEKIGANVVSVTYKNRSVSQDEWLKISDMETIKKVAPEIKNIATISQNMGTVRIGSKTKDTIMNGISSQYKSFSAVEMAYGRYINDMDVSAKSSVAVVEQKFAEKFFGKVDVVGQSIVFRTPSAENYTFKIIGVTKSTNDLFESIMEGDTVPAFIYVPITTCQNIFPDSQRLNSIDMAVTDKNKLKEIGDKVVKAMNAKHGGREIYRAENSAQQQKMATDVMGVISSVLLVIAIITLVVGGIGIVNILLVSVTERIREIGVRKALGAQKKDIILQFITESIVMTGLSGLVGIFLGIIAGNIISSIIKIPPVLDIKVIILAFLGSIALGMIFGVYPAKKAADLDPIESLRYE